MHTISRLLRWMNERCARMRLFLLPIVRTHNPCNNMNVNVTCTWSNHCHYPQHKIIVAYHTSNHRLANHRGQWWTIPIPRDNESYYFNFLQCSWNWGNTLSWSAPSPTSLEIDILPFWKGSPKSFFQLGHQELVDINLYVISHGGRCTPLLQGITLFDSTLMHF